MAKETEKSDMPASQTRAARGVLRRKGASFLRLFVRMFPDESGILISRAPQPGVELANNHTALTAYISERLRLGLPRALFPNSCMRSEEDRSALAPHILAAVGTSKQHWADILAGHVRAQGPVFQVAVQQACTGCPVRSCAHRRTKAHAA